ncbi:MAG: ABC transporter permease [Betaproteobacteria bacterium]|nr:ABC transporter permease [Betaproteobacteria bacterium]
MTLPRASLLLQYLWPWGRRGLIAQFAQRDVSARYRGSVGGLAWAFVTPLIMLAVYTFVFQNVFRARWPNGGGGELDFAVRLYAGLIVFNSVAEYLNRAPRLVLEQPNLVKRVVFPLEILSWSALASALFHLGVAAIVLVLAAGWQSGLSFTWIALPLVWCAMIPFLLGMGWFLAALGVYVKDLGQAVGLVVAFLQFLSPVFYPVEALPERWRPFLMANPLTFIIEQTRDVALNHAWPHWSGLLLYVLLGTLFAALGALFFQRARQGFADVL